MKYLPFSLTLAVAACSYTPLYAPVDGQTIATRVQVGEVRMTKFDDLNVGQRRVAQVMSQKLRQSFKGPVEADVLTVGIKEESSALALRRTALVEREQLNLTATATLTSPDGKQIFTTDIATNTAYNVETTPYATESGKTFARLTAARNAADEIVRRIGLYYRSQKTN